MVKTVAKKSSPRPSAPSRGTKKPASSRAKKLDKTDLKSVKGGGGDGAPMGGSKRCNKGLLNKFRNWRERRRERKLEKDRGKGFKQFS